MSSGVAGFKTGASHRSAVLGALGVVLAAYAAIVTVGIQRPGYSIDEEFTYLAVRGIVESGVPILPSGALEHRGLPYTYSAWLSGTVLGHGFPAYRLPSLVSGVISIAFIFRIARLAQPPVAALVTVAAAAALPWQIFSAEWARFYSMFLACLLWSLWLFWRFLETGRGLRLWLASVFLAHLLHDFAILLVTLPAVAAVLERGRRVGLRPCRVTLVAAGAFAASEAALFALHMVASAGPFRTMAGYALMHAQPIGWETFVDPTMMSAPPARRSPLEQFAPNRLGATVPLLVLGCAAGMLAAAVLGIGRQFGAVGGAFGGLAQFARLWFVSAMWAFSRPKLAVRTMAWSVAIAIVTAVLMAASVSWRTGAAFTIPFVKGLAWFALAESATVIRGLILNHPLATACFVASGVALAMRDASRRFRFPRLLYLWALTWLLAFDLLGVEFKPRYYASLWPLLLAVTMFGPRAMPASWCASRRVARVARTVALVVMAGLVCAEHYVTIDESRSWRCGVGDTLCVPEMAAYHAPDLEQVSGAITPRDVVMCSDELLCDVLIGRIDFWLYTGTLYAYESNEGPIGLYGGTPIIRNVRQLEAALTRHRGAPSIWLILPTLRKYPTWSLDQIVSATPDDMRTRMQIVETPTAVVARVTR